VSGVLPFTAVRTPLRVRPNDLDSLRHVNNAVVLEYFETGRWDWARHHAVPPRSQVVAVVSRAEIDYLRPIEIPEVEIHTELADPLDLDEINYKVCFRQHVLVPGAGLDRALVRALVHVAFLDTRSGTLATARDFIEQHE
jgi:YbgC/YbaW family acyl-CoA thioester hydrolase